MGGDDGRNSEAERNAWNPCKMPFWQTSSGNGNCALNSSSSSISVSSSSMSHSNGNQQNYSINFGEGSSGNSSNVVSSMAKALIPTRRRLRLDPSSKLYFPYEPGKQVKSAVGIKNICKSHVAFKFQTTAPKSCYMRPPGGVLAPGESIIATVFKFVEPPDNNEKPSGRKSRVKFKIMSLKVKQGTDYVPELFDEQKDQVAVEQVLRVVFLDPERSNPALEKLRRQLAEAESALETRKKPPQEVGPRVVGEGLVIDEWKERRERYLARQQDEGIAIDSV